VVIQATVTDWQSSQDALREEVERVTALLRSVRDPAAPAVGQWNISELAMHLSQAWLAVPGLARGDLSRFYEVIPSIADVAGTDTLSYDGKTISAVCPTSAGAGLHYLQRDRTSKPLDGAPSPSGGNRTPASGSVSYLSL